MTFSRMTLAMSAGLMLLSTAASAADVTLNAQVHVIKAISFGQTAPLDFGQIVAGSATPMTIDPDFDSGYATFTADGENGETATLSMNKSSVLLSNGEDDVTVNAFTWGGSASGGSVEFTGSPLTDLTLGATLQLDGNQTSLGLYNTAQSGDSLVITLAYQ